MFAGAGETRRCELLTEIGHFSELAGDLSPSVLRLEYTESIQSGSKYMCGFQ